MAKDKLSNDDKKALAYDLYFNTDKTQKEICEIIGTAEKTFTRWKQDGLWEELKGASTITSQSIITNIYKKMHDLTLAEGDIKADALAKLARVIEVVSDKKYTFSQIFNVFKEFINWLYPKEPELAKTINKHMRAWVDETINK